MGHSKAVAVAIALLFGPGCSTLLWSAQKSLRDPGERLRAFPERVFVEYECDKKRLPWFKLEKHELVPPRIAPGGEFNHRLVYSMCPARPTQVVTGTLDTRILFRGGPIAREQVKGYELKPGRWVVDWFVSLPPGAAPGVYALQVQFSSSRITFDETLSFAIDAP